MGEYENENIERRTIIRGAAWSIPVLGMAAAVPGASASNQPQPCVADSRDWNTPGEYTFTLTPAMKNIRFRVRGAGGGGNLGGQGALSVGTIDNLTSNLVVKIIVGEGGERYTGGAVAFGGTGYGRGGNSTPGPRDTAASYYGGGGGGSALLFTNNEPMVVSGGGGGQGVAHSIAGKTWMAYTFRAPAHDRPYGLANAGTSRNGRGLGMAREGADNVGFVVGPALGANGANGGRGGGRSHWVAENGNWTGVIREAGFDGGDKGTGAYGGGNGGNGSARMSNGQGMRAAGGGGGGGYAGGGGGGLAGAYFNDSELRTISGSSGAAGSSWVLNTLQRPNGQPIRVVRTEFGDSGLQSGDNRGHNGFVRLSWCL